MAAPPSSRPFGVLITLAAVAGVTLVLAAGRDLFVPFALAVLISFLLARLVSALEARRIGRILSVLLVSLMFWGPIAGIAWVVCTQFVQTAAMLPNYRENIARKLQPLRGPVGRTLAQAADMWREIGGPVTPSEPGTPSASTPPGPAASDEPKPAEPVPVTVVPSVPSSVDLAREALPLIASPLRTLAIVMILVSFILVRREDLHDRLVAIISRGEASIATGALGDVAERVGTYLRVQSAINIAYGAAVALGLFALGIPGAVLWGVLSAVLRFVPYVGPWLAALFPVLVSFAIGKTLLLTLETLGLFIILETIVSAFIEPWMIGSRTGVSAIALLVAALVWTWLWGIPGILLSTPLTVCLVVAGKHVRPLRFLYTLLSDEPVLGPEARLYYRLLSADKDDVSRMIDQYLEDHTQLELFDNLLLRVLRAAGRDRDAGTLEADRLASIHETIGQLLDRLSEADPAASERATAAAAEPGQPEPALIIPARDGGDVLAGRMLAMALATPMNASGAGRITARVLTLDELGNDVGEMIDRARPQVVCISAVPPHAAAYARLRVRQARRGRKRPAALMVGLWTGGEGESGARPRERLLSAGAAVIVETVAEARRIVGLWLAPAALPNVEARPATADAASRA